MHAAMPKSLPNFNNVKVMVVGDVMLDRYWFGDALRVSPEAPVPIVNVNNFDNRPGGAGNVALNLATLGTQVVLVGALGNDEAGQQLLQQLKTAKVEGDLALSDDISTIIKLRIISRHQQLLRVDFEKKISLASQQILEQKFKNHLNHVQLVILSDYAKGTLQNPQVFIQAAHAANVLVLVDPKNMDFSIYQNADIVTPNQKEFERIVGPCRSEQELIDKGKALIKKFNFGALLITRGENGMTMIETNNVYHLPAYASEVFDVTGAGDTVIATLGACYAAGASRSESMAIANFAASLTVGKLGAASVSVPELQSALTGKTTYKNGILNETQLLQAIKEVRAQNKKIIFTNGCFDILHAGHVAYLQMAKQYGDFLIVAVNSDETIKKIKGEKRPINSLEHRIKVLAGLASVDWVVPFNDLTPERLLKLIQPDLLVKGGDYQLNQVVGADIVRAYGGEVRIMDPEIIASTSSIVDKFVIT